VKIAKSSEKCKIGLNWIFENPLFRN